jgi:formylglycine-generating enzyme
VLSAGLAVNAQEPAMTNSLGMEFVLVRPGKMVVGVFQPPYAKPPDPSAPPPPPGRGGRGTPLTGDEYQRIEAAAKADALPGFSVTIDRPYYIGKFEVTQAQWRDVMGRNPSIFQGKLVEGPSDSFPVDNVTWDDARSFVQRLNAREKTTQYRLPTEFEWEFAARAGGDADVPWADIRQQAWAGTNRSTQAVGKMKPNAWGLHDMLGNVWEWVQDFYNEKLFADPAPPRSGKEHVLKGGGFVSDVKNAIPATHAGGPGSRFDVGLRVVRDVVK